MLVQYSSPGWSTVEGVGVGVDGVWVGVCGRGKSLSLFSLLIQSLKFTWFVQFHFNSRKQYQISHRA